MDKPVLLDFWAPWCAPCRALSPTLEALEKKLEGKLIVKKVNVDEEPELAQQYNVRSIPTLVLLGPDGQPKDTSVGNWGLTALEAWVTPLL